jgi:hypothetical protein
MNETLATTVARAGQFGDAISGSALALQKFAESEGSREFGTSTDNASIGPCRRRSTSQNLSSKPAALQERQPTLAPLQRDPWPGLPRDFELASAKDELQRL